MGSRNSTNSLSSSGRSFLFILAIIFVLCASAAAQQYKILDVRVSGNTRSSDKMITNVAALRIGSDYSPTAVQDAVRNLYAMSIFRDIVVDADATAGGVILTIKVSEYPQLSAIDFEGNKEISDKALKELLHLAPGGYITDNLIARAKNQIETEYMNKGYFLTTVKPQLIYTPDSAQTRLVFNIKEYPKIKVEKVVLTGSNRLKATDIIKKMSNRKHGFLRSSNFKKEKYGEDKEKIIAYCAQKGFIDAHLISDSFVVDTARNRMTIFIDIFEGPCYYFGQATFAGNVLYTSDKLTKVLTFQPGEIFDQEKYDKSIGELYVAYQEEGYLHTRIMDTRNTRDSLIDLKYEITEGLPSQINLVEITGNTKTKDRVIRREMMVRPAQTFHRSVLMRSLRDVMQLNYFSNVVPDVRDLPSGDIDLTIKVEEKPTGQVSAGAGYSGQDKLVGTFGLGIPNFRGNGQNVSLNVDFGSRRNSVSLSFTEPWFMGTPTLVGGEIFNLNRRWYDDFTEGRRGGSVRVGRRLRWPDNYCKAYLSYRIEDTRYFDFSDSYHEDNGETVIDPYGNQRYISNESSLESFNEKWMLTSAISFTVERDTRDLPTFATSGSRMFYTGEVSGGILGGSWDYYKHLFHVSKYYPLFWGSAIVGRFQFGYISSHNNDDIPYSERFSPGGVDTDGTVRGYKDASLSPRSSSGTILGGISEAVYNLEYQLPIIKGQIYLLAFADAGNSWISKKDIRPFSDLYYGTGFGFRLVVPGVGVIGFDFGYALDAIADQSKGWRPHFQVSAGY